MKKLNSLVQAHDTGLPLRNKPHSSLLGTWSSRWLYKTIYIIGWYQ